MKDEAFYVEHILECIVRIEQYTEDGRAAFCSSTLIQDAVLRNLQILAESSKRIDIGRQEAHPEIPWRQMAGFRSLAVHDYLGLDLSQVWEIVSIDIPVLKRRMKELLKEVQRPAE